MLEGEFAYQIHCCKCLLAFCERNRFCRLPEHLHAFQLGFITGLISAGGFAKKGAHLGTFFAVTFHNGHDLEPGADQRFTQRRIGLQGFGVDHGKILDVAGNLAGIVDQV